MRAGAFRLHTKAARVRRILPVGLRAVILVAGLALAALAASAPAEALTCSPAGAGPSYGGGIFVDVAGTDCAAFIAGAALSTTSGFAIGVSAPGISGIDSIVEIASLDGIFASAATCFVTASAAYTSTSSPFGCNSGGNAIKLTNTSSGDSAVITSTVTAGGTTYTAVFTATFTTTLGGVGVTITDAAVYGGAFGAAPSSASESIAGFLSDRAHSILSLLPDLTGFLDGGNSNGNTPAALAFSGDQTNYNMTFATSSDRFAAVFGRGEKRFALAFADSPKGTAADRAAEATAAAFDKGPTSGVRPNWNLWTRVSGAHASSGSASNDLWLATLGIHTHVAPDVILGLFVQGDWSKEATGSSGARADGLGYMAGPYLAAKLGAHMRMEARGAIGQSFNHITPTSGAAKDSFDTTRYMAEAAVSGSARLGSVSVTPRVRVSYFEEDQKAYTAITSGSSVPSQVVSLGELRFGPTFSRSYAGPWGGTITPSFGVEGSWDFAVRDGSTSQGVLAGSDKLRARLNAGLTIARRSGMTVKASGFYDGLGTSYHAYGGDVRLNIPLH